MRRAYSEVSQEEFKELMGDVLPSDAQIYAFEIVPNTGSIRIYFYSDDAPDIPEGTTSAYYLRTGSTVEVKPKRKR